MTRLTAPYNFVPLNDHVVCPDWADRVSMDVPFRGALCGTFDIEIEAETPLIVGGRTNASPEGQDAPSHKERATLFGHDVIPGTSLKGMLRAVVEIATFGRIGLRMDDRRFAVRDLHNAALYTRHMTEMFRLANRRSTRDLARQDGDGPDFADLLFGFVAEKGGDGGPALRGRVQIEPARLTQTGQREGRKKEILLAPKPGYYPAYVAQTHLKKGTPAAAPEVAEGTYRSDGKDRPYNAYTTYMDDDAKIRGWKRYPVSHAVRTSPAPTLKDRVVKDASQKVYNTFDPHGPGARFRATVHVHNLKREELGALLWAITFGGRSDTHRHSLGMAKPLGYGCVKVSIVMDSVDIDSVDGTLWDKTTAPDLFRDCMTAFEDHMDGPVFKGTGTKWAETPQILHLLSMADPAHGNSLAKAKALDIMAGPEPFQDAKKAGLVLPPVIDDPSGWPPQKPPPRIVEPGQGVASGGARTARRAAPPKPTRRGTVDGEPVDVLSIDGNVARVQFSDGDIEDKGLDEIEDLT